MLNFFFIWAPKSHCLGEADSYRGQRKTTCSRPPTDHSLGAEINHNFFNFMTARWKVGCAGGALSYADSSWKKCHCGIMGLRCWWMRKVSRWGRIKGWRTTRVWHWQLTAQKTLSLLRQIRNQHLRMSGSGVEGLRLLCSLKIQNVSQVFRAAV